MDGPNPCSRGVIISLIIIIIITIIVTIIIIIGYSALSYASNLGLHADGGSPDFMHERAISNLLYLTHSSQWRNFKFYPLQ